MIFKKTNSGFKLEENGTTKAECTLLWCKFDVNGKKVRQPYITDVASYQKGYGTLLMNGIINFFKDKKTDRIGYNSSKLHLDVNPNNFRAIALYERVGFTFRNYSEDLVENYLLEMVKEIN